MRSRLRRVGGFTLIELLVVFTLLALLLTIAVPRYLETADASRVKVREQNMATIRDALDKFKADQGRYPAKLEDLVDKRYLRKIPVDPVTDSTEWLVVEDSAKREAGVFDIAAPNSDASGGDPATTAPDPTTPRTPGAMPVPSGGVPIVGGVAPMPITKSSAP